MLLLLGGCGSKGFGGFGCFGGGVKLGLEFFHECREARGGLLAGSAEALVLELEVGELGFQLRITGAGGVATMAEGLFQQRKDVEQALRRAGVGKAINLGG